MPIEAIEVGEDIVGCGYCGGQLLLIEMMPDGHHEICNDCGQHYHVTDEGESAEDITAALAADIEIVDDATGEVVGTTAPGMTHPSELDRLLQELGGEVPMASAADLNHLFGIKDKPCPYGDEFGSF
jgi:hypothetical protein